MVNIVIVSHSAKLAEGVRELAAQMVQGKVLIVPAGGVDDPEHPIGTDALKVMAAIEAVYSEDGVVVLMDLGSALLSAETAVSLMPPEQQPHIYLCEAPLVEGAMAAAVQASVGGTVQQVMQEARGALAVKIEQLAIPTSDGDSSQGGGASLPESSAVRRLTLTIHNKMGLHARPAAQFVSTTNQFVAQIILQKNQRSANAKSINQVAMLGVRQGETVTITAVGADADEALTAIQALADANFGETEGVTADDRPPTADTNGLTTINGSSATVLAGIPAAPGVATGPVVQYRPKLPAIPTRLAIDIQEEWRKLQTAVSQAQQDLRILYAQATTQVGTAEAAIFEAHRLIMQDPALLETVKEKLERRKLNVAAIWHETILETAESYQSLEYDYMRERSTDVMDVGQRVLRHLLGVEPPSLNFDRPSILVAVDLTPSDTARLDPKNVLGICCEAGGATSHSAILAQALGIPAIVGLGARLESIPEGKMVGLDGGNGRFYANPTLEELTELEKTRQAWLNTRQEAKAKGQALAITKDKRRIEVAANIGGPHDTAVALEHGAEGVGLFRTEFLFLDRTTAPTEEEQYTVYRQVAQAMRHQPVIVRTLDVGGDKPLPYLNLGPEQNPFLGWRGIRFCLTNPSVFKPQLRAILRAGLGHNLKLMFPMVSTLAEVRAAKKILDDVQTELRQAGIPFAEEMEVGIMVEVPSAVAVADQLAKEVDFFSIGTNDLTQYVMAADRGNTRVANLAVALQPAVLRMIQQTVQAAHKAGIWVGLCGELAGNAQATAVLIGLGVDELSMSAPAIPAVKQAIGQLTVKKAKRIAKKVLELETAEAVQVYLSEKTKIPR